MLAILAAAAALSFPHYDVEAWCSKLAPRPDLPGGMAVKNQCRQDEQIAYEFDKATWVILSDYTKAECAAGRREEMPYRALETCIEASYPYEMQNNPKFAKPFEY